MDKDLKARWVTALRSGEFEQGTGYLSEGGRYCCLGVLCRVAEPELDSAGVRVVVADRMYVDGNHGVLTDDVAAILGMPNGSGVLNDMPTDEYGGHPELSALNDSGATFDQIADVIEYAL